MVLLLEPLRRAMSHVKAGAVIRYDRGQQLEVQLGEHMGSHLFWYGAYSRDVLAVLDRIVPTGGVAVDVGGNIGEISLAMASRVGPEGKVYAFEPSGLMAERLRANVRRNTGFNVEVVPHALGATAGRGTLYDAGGAFADGTRHEGVLTLYPTQERQHAVGETSVTTLDAFLAQRGISRLDVLKVDVEGAELFVLQGARETLLRFRPYVVIEVQEETSRAAGYNEQDLLRFLGELGYTFETIGRHGRLRSLTVATLGAFQNVLCTPAR